MAFLGFFAFIQCYKQVIWRRRDAVMSQPALVRALVMPYTLLYVCFGILVFEDLFVTSATSFGDGGLPECRDLEGKERCSPMKAGLSMLSMLSPVVTGLCYVVSAVHTFQHGYACNWGPLAVGHDLAVQIATLPIVYCLLSFKSVVHIWTAMAYPKEYEKYQLEMFDINYTVADCYEAWALLCFGKICMLYLQNAGSWDSDEARDLMTPLQKLLLQGLLGFCVIELCSAMYAMAVTLFQSYGICNIHPDACKLQKYCFGGILALSCLAIMNLVVFEASLGNYIHSLEPKVKFIYAKCLLSITCVQQTCLSFLAPYLKLSDLESDLLYASLVCLECFLLSLLNWQAWSPRAGWLTKVVPNPCAVSAGLEMEDRSDRGSVLVLAGIEGCEGARAAVSSGGQLPFRASVGSAP